MKRPSSVRLEPAETTTLEKKVSDFPGPSRDVTNQTLPGGE
jgi:hypothetical protein